MSLELLYASLEICPPDIDLHGWCLLAHASWRLLRVLSIAIPLLLHQGPSRMLYESSLNSRSTVERRGRWEKRWASVMWFSTFFKWMSSGASGGAPLGSLVSSMGMLTETCSSVLSAMVKAAMEDRRVSLYNRFQGQLHSPASEKKPHIFMHEDGDFNLI